MIHHDGRAYNVAAGEAARKGREKMEKIIEEGLASARSVAELVQSRLITDVVAKAPALRLRVQDDGSYGLVRGGDPSLGGVVRTTDGPVDLHPHALDQMLQNAGLPKKFAEHLVNESGGSTWGKELVARNVNEILARRDKQRNLLRHEGDENAPVKGFLSDKFRRIDSRPLLDAFMGSAAEIGLVPVQGVASDTKVRMRAIMPQVFEPIANEVMMFGVEWANSDYGDGGHALSLFVTRVWCTNMAMGDTVLRQVHTGKTLSDDIEYSARTYALDTKTNVSALRDTVRHAISPKRVNLMLEHVKEAGEKELKGNSVETILAKLKLSKTDAQAVQGLYDGPDVVNLPPGNTAWRLSNALSFFANAKTVGADKKLELEAAAGSLVHSQSEAALTV